MPKTKRELDLDIKEVLGSRSVAAGLKRDVGDAWIQRARQEPETSPKRLKHGDYIATFEGIENTGTPQASAKWKITRRGKEVGTMHESSSYGWGRPTTTMRQLVWSGVHPPGASDSRTPEYGLTFDQGPSDSHAQALAAFARAADRLISWRQKHGYAATGFAHSGKARRSTTRSGNMSAGGTGTRRRSHATVRSTASLRWNPAVRGSGEVTARSGFRAFVQPAGSGKWRWEVKPVGYEMIDPKRSIGEGTANSKAKAKAAAGRALLSQL